MEIRELGPAELGEGFLRGFRHEQRIRKIWVCENAEWTLRKADLLRSWNEGKRRWIPQYLAEQIARGGSAFGAYADGKLAGFTCTDGPIEEGCVNLTMLFVDDGMQHMGVGKALLARAAQNAADRGARGLYISAIPSADTIAFYFAQGCRDTSPIGHFVDSPEDRALMLPLSGAGEWKLGGICGTMDTDPSDRE